MIKKESDVLCVVLAGGYGLRVWPLSTKQNPKQFLDIFDSGFSKFQSILKFSNFISTQKPLIIGNLFNKFTIFNQITAFDSIDNYSIIFEQTRLNTFGATIIACMFAIEHNINNIVLLPSDHFINDYEILGYYISMAINYIKKENKIGLLGIKPTSPSTEYGYIKTNDKNTISDIVEFIEKPILSKAEEYISGGSYLWNSGIFIFNKEIFLSETKFFNNDFYNKITEFYINKSIDNILPKFNEKDISLSIDYGLIEKTKNAFVISCDVNFEWNDVGILSSIHAVSQKDKNDNCIIGNNIIIKNTKNCCIINKSNSVLAINKIENANIVLNDNIVSINKDSYFDENFIENVNNYIKTVFENRPWGTFEVLSDSDQFKVKKIIVFPTCKLSLQFHNNRNEHWIIISGYGIATIENKQIILKENDSFYIPLKVKHRIENTSKTDNLVFIEIQTGSFFDEEDIVRIEDDFDRIG